MTFIANDDPDVLAWVSTGATALGKGLMLKPFAVWIGAEGAATGAHDLKELMDKQGLLAIAVGVVLLLVVLAILHQVGKRALRAAGLS